MESNQIPKFCRKKVMHCMNLMNYLIFWLSTDFRMKFYHNFQNEDSFCAQVRWDCAGASSVIKFTFCEEAISDVLWGGYIWCLDRVCVWFSFSVRLSLANWVDDGDTYIVHPCLPHHQKSNITMQLILISGHVVHWISRASNNILSMGWSTSKCEKISNPIRVLIS